MKVLEDVKEFRAACGMVNSDEAGWPGDMEADLCAALITEEYNEVMGAIAHKNIFNFAQELVDLIYVVCFAAAAFGIPLGRVWGEVQAANMRKVDPETGKVRRAPNGKVLKPEGWYPADIEKAVYPDKGS